MTQVSDVSASYAVGSKQAAAAATQLNALADELRDSIAQFRTEGADNAHSRTQDTESADNAHNRTQDTQGADNHHSRTQEAR